MRMHAPVWKSVLTISRLVEIAVPLWIHKNNVAQIIWQFPKTRGGPQIRPQNMIIRIMGAGFKSKGCSNGFSGDH